MKNRGWNPKTLIMMIEQLISVTKQEQVNDDNRKMHCSREDKRLIEEQEKSKLL